MEGYVRLIADHPAIVTGRARGNVEQDARAEFVNGAIFHGSRSAAGNHHSYMFNIAA
jgi:hypothetical protein